MSTCQGAIHDTPRLKPRHQFIYASADVSRLYRIGVTL
jgi:hypothetical protein